MTPSGNVIHSLPERPLNSYIDHTLLSPVATESAITNLCEEAILYSFRAICVNGCNLKHAKKLLPQEISLAAVVGFPLGANTTASKLAEAENALGVGADELDVVLNLGWVKSLNYDAVLQELTAIRNLSSGAVLKLILETCYLEESEKIKVCEMAATTGWDFVKTSTGFGGSGATAADVQLMNHAAGPGVSVKASGGIRTLDFALELISAGADRLGTSSGVSLMNALTKHNL